MSTSSGWKYVSLTIIGPTLLFTAIFFSSTFYTSYCIRKGIFAAIAVSTLATLQRHSGSHPIASFFFGLLSAWSLIWSAVLLLVFNPHIEFRRIRIVDDANSTGSKSSQYGWEAFPKSISMRRLYWTLDLILNFRGIGWSYRNSKLPTDGEKCTFDSAELNSINANCRGMAQIRAGKGRQSFVLGSLGLFLRDYLLLDLCSHLFHLDPFFSESQANQFLSVIPPGPIYITSFRLLLSLVALYAWCDIIFVGFAILSVGVFGDRWMGTHGEPWMHPRLWGSIWDCYHKGLRGLWGSFWHDVFRFGFERLPSWGLSALSIKIGNENVRRLLEIQFAFFITGYMHAVAVHTMAEDTSRYRVFLFYAMQAPGIALQGLIATFLKGMHIEQFVITVMVFGYSLVWCYITVFWLVEELAVGGYFRAMSVPWSFLSMLR